MFFLSTACSDYREFAGADAYGDRTECEINALEAFKENISPAIADSCAKAGCHVAGHQAFEFSTDQVANRQVLLDFSNGQVSTLTNKIYAAAPSHGGDNQSTNLPIGNIEAWLSEEAKCQ